MRERKRRKIMTWGVGKKGVELFAVISLSSRRRFELSKLFTPSDRAVPYLQGLQWGTLRNRFRHRCLLAPSRVQNEKQTRTKKNKIRLARLCLIFTLSTRHRYLRRHAQIDSWESKEKRLYGNKDMDIGQREYTRQTTAVKKWKPL